MPLVLLQRSTNTPNPTVSWINHSELLVPSNNGGLPFLKRSLEDHPDREALIDPASWRLVASAGCFSCLGICPPTSAVGFARPFSASRICISPLPLCNAVPVVIVMPVLDKSSDDIVDHGAGLRARSSQNCMSKGKVGEI